MFEKCGISETVAKLMTDEENGLTVSEAQRRLMANGKNEMQTAKSKSFLQMYLQQLQDPLIYVLMAAVAVSLFLGEYWDAVIIATVVFTNALIGVIQEGKAQKALEALKKLSAPKAIVIREGIRQEIPTALLVSGDLVCLEAGNQVPADVRLVETNNLKIEESSLTGESVPIEKDALFLVDKQVEASLGDRRNMAYMSTVVTYGRGKGIVTATGMQTQIGQIAALIHETGEELTPLQKRLGDLGKVLSLLSVFLCAALFVMAIIQKREVMGMFLIAISLAVAAVPEGLPAVVTICLALSVTRMVKVHTIVRRLPSVETLGAVSVVCSDKTGTLTQNRMTVESCYFDGKLHGINKETCRSIPGELIQGMVLCNDACLNDTHELGDPTEVALLLLGESTGADKECLEQKMPRIDEIPFDCERKMMSTLHKADSGTHVCYTKGAPDEVLKRCTDVLKKGKTRPITSKDREGILAAQNTMAAMAQRTLAVAMKTGTNHATESKLVFVGMVGMKDPLRPEAKEAVGIFRQAGVSTVMITGDHIDTAYAIGRQLDIVANRRQCMTGGELETLGEEEFLSRLDDTRIFARVSPIQKVKIVKGLKMKGHIVAMTGDGVNDAPSLKMADIGIAMGKSGTDVAKQAADIILTDDNFATIEKAIEEGRGVYENIRKSVIFLLSSNLGELMTMFAAVIFGLQTPLKSSHILWINLITDSLPALALGIDKNDGRSLMGNLPRKSNESLFARGGLLCTCFYGVLIALASLTAYFMLPVEILGFKQCLITPESVGRVFMNSDILTKAQTYAFTVLGMSQLFHAVGMRDTEKSVFRMKPKDNPLMLLACVVGFLLQFAVTEIPFLVKAFGTASLSLGEWGILGLLASAPLVAHEFFVLFSAKTICHYGKK